MHRTRPILLTAAAASLALIPISREVFWGPMAYAMMGGIIVGRTRSSAKGWLLLVATALDVRDVNLMELAAALPRAAERLDMRYQWISRLLGNPLIDTDAVMAPFAREVLARAGAHGRTLVLIIDQSQVNAAHQMVMVSLRVGGRALPLAWRVKETQGRDRLCRAARGAWTGWRPCCPRGCGRC